MPTEFKTLPDLFESSVARFTTAPLFGTKQSDGTWEWLSYSEFGKQVADARAGLAGLGVRAGDRVAIISDNRVEWAVGAYGTYTLGGAWVPMYEAQQSKEWQYILADSGAKVVIAANDGIRAQLDDHAHELPDLEHTIVIDGNAGGQAITFPELLARGARKLGRHRLPRPIHNGRPHLHLGDDGKSKGRDAFARQPDQQRQYVSGPL